MRNVMLLSASLVCLGVNNVSSAEDPRPGQQVAQTFSGKSSTDTLGYWLYLPKNHGQGNEKFPLLLFLHGSGERGQELAVVKKHGPPKLIEQGKHFPFVVVSPQCPANQRWNAALLLALLDDLEAKYAIDPQRVCVTGLSMGGSGTWSLVAAAPQRFAAAVPICGHGDPWMAGPASRLPVWVVVGDKDGVAANCIGMVDSLRARGADVKFTLMPGVGHDSWTPKTGSPPLLRSMSPTSPACLPSCTACSP